MTLPYLCAACRRETHFKELLWDGQRWVCVKCYQSNPPTEVLHAGLP